MHISLGHYRIHELAHSYSRTPPDQDRYPHERPEGSRDIFRVEGEGRKNVDFYLLQIILSSNNFLFSASVS